MEQMLIKRITEEDFDTIIKKAGGKRVPPREANKKGYNADYILGKAIIELKLLREEGLVKKERRSKIAELFNKTQPDKPVIIIDPKLLTQQDRQEYYDLLGRPIQTAVRKAAKQLRDTKERYGDDFTCVLIIINDGYTALDADEFVDVVGKKVRHDTTKIDFVISGGQYYYSDSFDMYYLPRFDLIPVNINKSFPSYEKLESVWIEAMEERLTKLMFADRPLERARLPVVDLNFNVNGIEYVKNCPRMGNPYKLSKDGKRPRDNSTGVAQCPPVAVCYPYLTLGNWLKLRKLIPSVDCLQADYKTWIKWTEEQESIGGTELKPFINIEVRCDDYQMWCDSTGGCPSFSSVKRFCVKLFQEKINLIMENAIDATQLNIIPPACIFVETDQIGQDMMFDMSSIYYVNAIPGVEQEEIIIKNRKIIFEHALALGASYAIKKGVDVLVYKKNTKYA